MAHTRKWLVLTAVGILAVAQLSSAQTPRRTHKTQSNPVALPAMPPGPLTQLPMDQIPAAPPRVNYQNGLLTIEAHNSTLADILRDVRRLTGASIDVPANATERVVTRLGPGPARDVLAGLLNGSAFNYVMMGSASDPTALATVLLTPKPSGGASETNPNPSAAMASQPAPVYAPPERFPAPVAVQPAIQLPADADNADADDSSDDEADDAEDQSDDNQANPNGQQGVPQPNAGPKTPEQILQMMQQKRAPGTQPPYVQPNQPPNPQPPE